MSWPYYDTWGHHLQYWWLRTWEKAYLTPWLLKYAALHGLQVPFAWQLLHYQSQEGLETLKGIARDVLERDETSSPFNPTLASAQLKAIPSLITSPLAHDQVSQVDWPVRKGLVNDLTWEVFLQHLWVDQQDVCSGCGTNLRDPDC